MILKELRIKIPWPERLDAPMVGVLRSWLPTRGSVVFTILLVTGLFWAQTAGALPLPQGASSSLSTLPYQGRLADANGVPLTGTYTMAFRLYAAGSGGTPLWEEAWTGPNGVQVSDGLFNVMLGSLSPIPQTVITTNPTLWLGVTVGTDDEMAPRVQIGTLPFAVQALTVPDGAITSTKLAAGAITTTGIADGTIATADLANGAVTQAKLGPDISLSPPDGSITGRQLAANGFGTANQPLLNFVPLSPGPGVVNVVNVGSQDWAIVDLAGVVPVGTRAVLIYGYAADQNSQTVETEIRFDAGGVNQGAFTVVPFRHRTFEQGLVPLDANRRIAYRITASGANTFSAIFKIIGYYQEAQQR